MKTSTLKMCAWVCTLLITNLFFVRTAFSQTNTWDGSSSNLWNTGSNWSLNHVPTSSENVLINKNANISVNTSTTINNLTISGNAAVSLTSYGGGRTITIDNNGSSIAGGSTLTLNGSTGSGTRSMTIAFSGSNRTISIAGTLVVTATGDGSNYNAAHSLTTVMGRIKNTGGTISSSTSDLSFSYGGFYEHAIDGGAIPNATWNSGSTCLISVSNGTAPSGLAPAGGFANFTWDCASGTGATSLAGELTTVNGDFTVAHTGTSGSLRLVNGPAGNNFILDVGGNFSLTGGSLYIMGTSNSTGSETMKVNGDVIVTGGTLDMSGNSLPGELEVKGNFYHTGGSITKTSGSGIIRFTGSSAQSITGGGTVTGTISYILNNSSTSGVTLLSPFTISTGCSLTMTNGNIYSSSSNLLIFDPGATVNGASDNSYVDGPVRKIGNEPFIFPLGKSGIFGCLSISAPSLASDAFTAEYFRSTPPDTDNRIASLSQISGVDYWKLDRSVGNSFVNVTLSWTARSADGSMANLYGSNSTVARHNTAQSKWLAYSNSGGFTGSSIFTGGTVTWDAANAYDDFFAIGLAPSGSVLPVKFKGIEVKKEGNAARVSWNVASEENLLQYQVEKSSDGIHYISIATISAGNFSHYSYLDGPNVTGKTFYRIKSIDLDGSTSYSPVATLSSDQPALQLKAFPVPVKNQVSIQHAAAFENARISLSSSDGRTVQSLLLAKGDVQTSLDLSGLKPGFYIIQFWNGPATDRQSIKIFKQ
jgi:hypothetical protein